MIKPNWKTNYRDNSSFLSRFKNSITLKRKIKQLDGDFEHLKRENRLEIEKSILFRKTIHGDVINRNHRICACYEDQG